MSIKLVAAGDLNIGDENGDVREFKKSLVISFDDIGEMLAAVENLKVEFEVDQVEFYGIGSEIESSTGGEYWLRS